MAENREPFDLKKFAAQHAKRSDTLQPDPLTPSSPSFTLVAETSSRSIMNRSSLERHGRHSGGFEFDKRGPSLRDSSAENSQEPNDIPNLPTDRPTTSTRTLGMWSWIFLTILVALALAWKNYPAVDSDLLLPQSDHCYNQNPVDFINAFSLSNQINIAAHKAVLNELHELRDSKTLEKLVHTRSKVYSSLEVTNKDLMSRFACAFKEYAYSNGKSAELVFLNQINITQAQLDLIVLNVSELSDLYHLIKPAYLELELATAKAVQAVQLNDMHHYAIKAQPWIFQVMGLDAKKSFWDPWMEKSEKWKEAQSGRIALEGEIQRLDQIALVVRKVLQQSEQLRQVVQETAVKKEGREKVVESDESTRQWFKQWFRQNIVQHIEQDGETLTASNFDSWWESLCCGPRA